MYEQHFEKKVPFTDEDQRFLVSTMEQSTKLTHFVKDMIQRSNGLMIHPVPNSNGTRNGELIIVTSEWVRALMLLALIIDCPVIREKFVGNGFVMPKVYMYYGEMSVNDKRETLKQAELSAKQNEPSVMLLSFHTGAVGLNLFFSRCVMHLEGWWNKAMMDQMAARVHRNGQLRECDIHQYVIEGTIEQYILWLQDDKYLTAMNIYGNDKEKEYAKQQQQKSGGNAGVVIGVGGNASPSTNTKQNNPIDKSGNNGRRKTFKMKDAVNNLKKIRSEYATQTSNHSLLKQGFRSRIEVTQPDKDIRQSHFFKSLEPTTTTATITSTFADTFNPPRALGGGNAKKKRDRESSSDWLKKDDANDRLLKKGHIEDVKEEPKTFVQSAFNFITRFV